MNFFEILILIFPLVCVLLSLALMPQFFKRFWNRNETKILFAFAFISLISVFIIIPEKALKIFEQGIIQDYIPFIIMIFTLYVLGSGIHIELKSRSTTFANIIFLMISSVFASFIGTTGASVLFIKPFLEMNKNRHYKTHLIVFFIFLVSNIGGLLTPLGDPPLLLGYLHGVSFTWTMTNMLGYWGLYVFACLFIMCFIDKYYLQKEKLNHKIQKRHFNLKIKGTINILFIILTVIVLFFDFNFKINIPNICLKNVCLLIFCLGSYLFRKGEDEKIDFSPFKEVAKTFLVIFVVIAPVLHILDESSVAIQKFMIGIGSEKTLPAIYFALCSFASSFLDNAPSYLLFFNMAGGNAMELMSFQVNILKAISISAVVMGSMTYIGNAPNMIIKSIATKRKVEMPSFLGYMAWSSLIILPISLIVVWILISE